jgi:hypothetical protein
MDKLMKKDSPHFAPQPMPGEKGFSRVGLAENSHCQAQA